LTSSIGLSLSLGAFLAGLIVSESEYRHEAIGDILPFRDVFTSFFFISIGMLLDIEFVLAYPALILLLTVSVLSLKSFVGVIASLFVGVPLRTALLVGLCICQIGEFSFVLAKNGINYGLTDDFRYQMFLAVSLLSMGLTPTLIAKGSFIAGLILKLPFPEIIKTGFREEKIQGSLHKNHLIIIGYGFLGHNLAKASREAKIPYAIVDMNAQAVREEKNKGEPIYFGDATHESVLNHLNLAEAKMVVIVINDFVASCRIVEAIRRLNPHIYCIVRTRYFSQTNMMYELGASDVIPDELGSSVEVAMRMMNRFEIPTQLIEEITNDTRVASYKTLQSLYSSTRTLYDLKYGIPQLGVDTFRVGKDFVGIGKSLSSLDIRGRFGINILAIKRSGQIITHIDANTELQENDWITVSGEHSSLKTISKVLDPIT
jgi:CPA2 family monovalent cation:H+ antiporter-2